MVIISLFHDMSITSGQNYKYAIICRMSLKETLRGELRELKQIWNEVKENPIEVITSGGLSILYKKGSQRLRE